MTQKDNILKELNELKSSLANVSVQNVYVVPAGYFDTLINEVLNRIRALDTEDASEELSHLSPLLAGISKEMPYSVPVDFFSTQAEKIRQIVGGDNEEQTAAEELETLSPLLSGLKKEMPGHPGGPFSVPQGYFDEINVQRNIEETKPAAKVVSITTQKWFRYAAAAMVIGFIAIGGLLFINKDKPNGSSDTKSIVSEMMQKVTTEEINKFVQLAEPVLANVEVKNDIKDKNDVQELIKDIPDNEIQKFLDDTVASETGNNDDDVLMN